MDFVQEAYRKALQENGDSRLKENVNNNIGELKARLGGGEVVAGPGLVAREQENLFAGLWMPGVGNSLAGPGHLRGRVDPGEAGDPL